MGTVYKVVTYNNKRMMRKKIVTPIYLVRQSFFYLELDVLRVFFIKENKKAKNVAFIPSKRKAQFPIIK